MFSGWSHVPLRKNGEAPACDASGPGQHPSHVDVLERKVWHLGNPCEETVRDTRCHSVGISRTVWRKEVRRIDVRLDLPESAALNPSPCVQRSENNSSFIGGVK